jgi:hypothetical protein
MMEKAALRRTLVAQAKVVLQNQADSLTKKTDEMRARGLIVAADKLAAIAQLRTQAGTATDGTKLAEVSLRLRAKWADIMADAYTDHAKQLNARFLATIESVSRSALMRVMPASSFVVSWPEALSLTETASRQACNVLWIWDLNRDSAKTFSKKRITSRATPVGGFRNFKRLSTTRRPASSCVSAAATVFRSS